MKQVTATLLATAIAAAVSPVLYAQWPLHPKPGVPKAADGTVNVMAPAPRTPDGKPDLSGIWMRSTRTEKPGTAPAGQPSLATFQDLGAGMKGGLPYQPWAGELMKKRLAGHGLENPDSLCLPQGPMMFHLDPQPKEIIQLPHKTIMVHESNYMIRTIYTDGRALPKQGEPQPYWHGYSVGRWDGDTLVVDSNNFRGALGNTPSDGWLDFNGSPFTDALRLTERFRRVNFGNLHVDITIDDPKAYTRPFAIRVEQTVVADGSELIEFICHENQQFLKMTGRQ
jgi:hypothetical protein